MTIEADNARSREHAKISVVTTAWNEEENVSDFVSGVSTALDGAGCRDYEILVVDNGSRDRTLDILKRIASGDSRVKYVSLSRNFGHQGGLIAGMEHASGDAVITMDADLQHPPSEIPRLLEKWEGGFDVVGTSKTMVRDVNAPRRVLNFLFYKGLSLVCGIPLNENQSDFRLLDRAALDALISLPEKTKFLRGLSHWIGFRHATVVYTPAPRFAGRTKFTLPALFSFTVRGVISFSLLPLRLFTLLGTLTAVGAFVYGLWVAYVTLFGASDRLPPGWASIAVAISFLGGIQLIGIGVIGEYVGRTLSEVHGRPAYIVREASVTADRSR